MGRGSKGKRFNQEVEARVRERMRISLLALSIRILGDTLHALIKFGTFAAVAWAAAWAWVSSAEEIAGEDTSLSLDLQAALNFFASKWFYWTVVLLMGGSFATMRKTYQKRLAQIADEKKELEKLLDPGRSSSRLRDDAKTEHD